MEPTRRLRLTRFAVALAAGAATVAAAQSPISPAIDPPAATKKPAATRDGMSAELFYRLLLGDIAMQRGETVLAARAYLEAAREAQDPRIARRATEIALVARQRAVALEAAKLWAALEPTAERPKQVVAALASSDGRDGMEAAADDELKQRLARALADSMLTGGGVGEAFLQLNRLFAQQPDKKAVYVLIRDVAQPYPTSPEAHFAVALAAYNTGLDDPAIAASAMKEIDRALELKPGWDRGAVLKAELLGKNSPDVATAYLVGFLKENPDARPVAATLAQRYVEQKKYAEARALMQKLWDADKSSRDLEYAVASIALSMKDYAEAERLFGDLKTAGYGEPGAMDLYLAQIAEEQKRYDEAIERYRAVQEGDRAWLAKLRIAAMMGKQGKLAEARRYLNDLPAVTIDERVQVRQAEAQLLREANDLAGAYAVLDKSIAQFPESAELLYDSALLAERLDRIDEAEAKLRKLVALKPDDAQTLNALGYTLVDRTPRTQEGFELIERAHKLSPNDPFILDSMGWALFRMGKLDEAEAYLKRALAERPDAEIAAHLGEVLWARGDRDSARAVWNAQLEANPDNAVLKETVKRLTR